MTYDVEASSTAAVDVAGGARMLNFSGLPDTVVTGSADFREAASQLQTWVHRTRQGGTSTLFNRGVFMPPDNPYEEMRAARAAVQHDDIVSGVAENTEGLAFGGIKWEAENPDDADVFNQLSAELNLDGVVRAMYREDFTYSQVFVAQVWGTRSYTVRGRNPAPEVGLDKVTVTDPLTGQSSEEFHEKRDPDTNLPVKRGKGTKRKKRYENLWVPTGLRILDPAKIVPLGIGPLGDERYAWQATDAEIGLWHQVVDGTKIDVGMGIFFRGPYTPGLEERRELLDIGVDPTRLLEINPDYVFRHCSTKPDYLRFPDLRLKSCFSLLDLKRQLIAADRAMLVGAANYILLVRKGSPEEPATQKEIDNLKSNYQFVAKLPVIISDHRLEIEIIAPKIDLTLQQEKYDTLDTRLLTRLLGTLSIGHSGNGTETQDSLSHAVARALENRRHMLRRTLERHIAREVVEHPRNAGKFEAEPNLVYTPRNISLGWEQPYLQALLNLRTQREISRETLLEVFGLDQATEAQRREMEAERFDDIFQTQVPFSSPQMNGPNGGPVAPGVAGAMGGRPTGGGKPKANTTKAAPKTPAGNTSTRKGSA